MKVFRILNLKTLLFTAALVSISVCVQKTMAQESLYYIELLAVDNIDVLDAKGSVFKAISPHAGIVLRDVSYEPGTLVADAEEERRQNPGRAVFWAPNTISFDASTAKHEVRFRTTSSEMMEFEIRKGSGSNSEDTDLLIRYVDAKELGIPGGINARFLFTPGTVSDLQLDTDRNGTYETVIKPQFRAVGKNAKDDEAPRITMTASISSNVATITLAATDTGSGVKDIQYQIGDGNPIHHSYTGPFKVDISKDVIVFAIADDFAGNRGMNLKVFEGGREKAGADPFGDPFKLRSKPTPDATVKPSSDPFQLKSKPE